MKTARLSELFRLPDKVVVYVPTRNNKSEILPAELIADMEEKVARTLSKINGGCTITDGTGFWVLDTGETCKENVRLCTSYTTELEKSVEVALELVKYIKETACQEGVSLEVNNELYIA